MKSHFKFLKKNINNIEDYLLISLNANVYDNNLTETINGLKFYSINLDESNRKSFRYHIIKKENL